MEWENGRCDDMEAKLQYGSHRHKSKVPRVSRGRADYAACSSGLPLRKTSPSQQQGGMSLAETDENKEWLKLVGERVCISGVKPGILRYFGRTNFAQGYWCGIELDEPVGKNNGTVHGAVYFSCQPDHGIFAPISKVSRLNDLNAESEWPKDHPRWNLAEEKRISIRNSISDPSFLQAIAKRATIPRCSESFSCDRRSLTQEDKCFSKSHNETGPGNVLKNSSSSHVLGKYGYGHNKNQYFNSKVACLSDSSGKPPPLRCVTGHSRKSGLTSNMDEYGQFLRTPTNSGEVSPLSSDLGKRFNALPFYENSKMPEGLFNAFQSNEFSDFEDDDPTSADYDESLGILTPSQMKNLTLGSDFPTSLGDIRGLDFPSSESFDDINDLPEDEQVHDVSVFRYSESARNSEISQQNSSFKKFNKDKFVYMSQGENERLKTGSSYISNVVEGQMFSSDNFNRTFKVNNAPTTYAFCTEKISNVDLQSPCQLQRKRTFSIIDRPGKNSDRISVRNNSLPIVSLSQQSDRNEIKLDSMTSVHRTENDADKSPELPPPDFAGPEEARFKNCEATISKDYPLSTETEGSTILREKLTVSWEDCLSHNNSMSTRIERPESVYTVCSNDTGYQEDGELECEAAMATSVDSIDEHKRYSTISRDSCIVADEMDAYKIAESNSTSGYSTGLSDSCCNDRAEDKPLTDEETQDGPCDSEDAFSFNENSSSKEMDMNIETSVTTENLTALCNNDSTSDALCETMVEDSTLTEIHDLLLSPEEKRSPVKDAEALMETKDADNDDPPSIEMKDPGESSISTNSPVQSTPEKAPNTKTKDMPRNASVPVSSRESRTARVCNDDSKKQVAAKSPKKNVMSKIKAMIEATSCKTNTRNKPEEPVNRRTASAPKKSRWDAVTSKIAASLAEEKTKPKAKRDIRSRVDTNLSTALACKSPMLDLSCGEGSLSPTSISSRSKRPLTGRNSAPTSLREGLVKVSRDIKQRPSEPRPGGKGGLSRCASPSESSTASVSLTSHNSRNKVTLWKGSTSTIGSSAPPPSSVTTTVKRPSPVVPKTTSIQSTRTTNPRTTARKPLTVPKIRISPSARSQSPAVGNSRAERAKTPRAPKTTKEQTGGRGVSNLKQPPVRPPLWLSKAELSQEIQRLGNLCEVRTKELNRLKMETKHVSVGFDAFAALFKYMVEDLNGLSVPVLSGDLKKTLKQLELAKQDLAYYEREVEELKAHHCQELNDLSNKLFEVFQGEVTELSSKHQEEMDYLKQDHQKQIESLSVTFDAASDENRAKQEAVVEKWQQELITQRDELQLFHGKELQDLEEKHAQSTKTLQEHVEQLQKKCAELKHHSLGMEDAMRKDTDTKLQWVTSRKGDLEKEVESLKAVLEMKNKELHTIRVQNLEMEKQLEELPLAREKIKMLQARAEDLEALMIEKTRLERTLSTENQQIKETFERETKVNRRLSMENEELQWRLRQTEQSVISGSFSEVSEYPEEVENGTISPVKSPLQMGRSVFFTFSDKDCSTPRSQYKKILPGFSANYKISPAKSSSSVPSPRRAKSHSEPVEPSNNLTSTPRKVGKQPSVKQKKLKRSGSDCSGKSMVEQTTSGTLSVMSGSMASSFGSECSAFEQREGLLEEHKEEILQSLEILREQQMAEENSNEGRATENVTLLENGDMSRSAEFSDPKTYYHMTFPVMKEGEAEDSSKVVSPENDSAQLAHSNVDSQVGDGGSSQTSMDTSAPTPLVDRQRSSVRHSHSQESVCETKDGQDRWRTI